MGDYDGLRFEPPAPVANVTVRRPDDGREQRDVPMLMDSGADVTLIPRHVVASLGLAALGQTYEVVGFDGQAGEVPAVSAALVLAGRTYTGQFLVTDTEWGILGRNILNTLVLTLDGPRRQWRST